MKKVLVVVIVVGMLSGIVSGVNAGASDVPQMMNYQGRLTDTSGNLITGSHSITLVIYDVATEGTELWTETHPSVSFDNGIFHIVMGSVTPIDLSFGEDYWLGITIDSTPELDPRRRLVSVGYAFRADVANSLSSSSGDVIFTLPSSDGSDGQVLTTDGSGSLSFSTVSGGDGDVTGPGSSTDNAIVRFDGTTGKSIQNSSVTIDDSGNLDIGGTLDVTGVAALDGGLAIDTDKFTVADTTGNTAVGGTLDVTGATTLSSSLDVDGAVNLDQVSINTTDGGFTVSGTNKLNLDSSNASANAVRLISSNTAGGIDIDAGTGGIILDSTGALSLDSGAASNFTTSAGALSLDGAGGINIAGNAAEVDVTTTGALDINSGAMTFDASTLSLDSTDASNLTMTANDAGNKTLTISATNAGVGKALIDIDGDGQISLDTADTTDGLKLATATSGVPISIGHTVSEVTINDKATITGTLKASGLTYPMSDGGTGHFLKTDGSGNLSFAAAGGSGDVTGPGSSTDNAIVRFDGTTGKIIQNSSVTIDNSGNTAIDGNLAVNDVDARTATPLLLGKTTAIGVTIADTGVTTTIKGTLNVDEAVTLDTTLDVDGATNLDQVTINTNDGAFSVSGTNLVDLNPAGSVTIDSSEGIIGLGTDANTGAINVGTSATARTITVGNASSTEAEINALLFDLNAGANGITIDTAGTLSLDSTDTSNFTMTANDAGDKILTISATNAGVGKALIDIDSDGQISLDTADTGNGLKLVTATSGVPISIGHTTSEVTINDNATITGALTASGLTYPTSAGTSGQVLTTNGSDTLSWGAAGSGSSLWAESGSDVYRSSGKVGIGTDSPASVLELVKGNDGNIDKSLILRNTGTSVGTGSYIQFQRGTGTALANIIGLEGTSGQGHLAFHTGASGTLYERVRIDPSGRLGIGTTNPQQYLHLYNSGPAIRIEDTNGDRWDIENVNGEFWIQNDTDERKELVINGNGSVLFNGGGDVGIGTSSPGSKLDVKGILRLSGATSGFVGLAPAAVAGSTTYTLPAADGSGGQVLTTDGDGTLSWGASASAYALHASDGDPQNAVYVNESGNVGIGTTNPNADAFVHIKKENNQFTRMIMAYNRDSGTSAVSSIELQAYNLYSQWNVYGQNHASNPLLMQFGTTTAGDVAFMTGYNEKMRIQHSTGNVGIGTNNPGAKLHVNGAVKIGEYTLPSTDGDADQVLATDGSGTLSWATAGGGGGSSLDAADGDPTNAVYVDNDGNVGIGTTSPGYPLEVNGTIMGEFSAGDVIIAKSNNALACFTDSYLKVSEMIIGWGGTLRITFEMRTYMGGGDTIYGRIYRNGSPVGTERSTNSTIFVAYAEDISGWSPGDAVQVYVKRVGTGGSAGGLLTLKAAAGPFITITYE